MAEHSVKLPEPRSDDPEDVVWGLSTAGALWARGERRDAIVWIRRAAEAAEAAGNPFRASELGMYLPELEKALQSAVAMPPEEPAPVSDAAPISSFEVVLDDTPPPPVTLPTLAIPPLGPVTPAAAPAPASAAVPPTMPPEAAPTPPTMPPAAPSARTPSTMPPAAIAPAPVAPAPSVPAPAVPVVAPSPLSGRQTPVPGVPSASTIHAKTSPPAVASVRPQVTVPRTKTIAPPATTVATPPRPPSDVPVARAATPVEDPPSVDEGRSALPPPAPQSSAAAPVPTAPAASTPADASAAAEATSATQAPVAQSPVPAAPVKRKQNLRTPILDPWSEASTHEVSPRERRRRQGAGDSGAAARPRARMLLDEEEDDILTSAAPLAETLGKKHQGGAVVGGTGLAASPATPAAVRAGAPPPPPLPPRAPAAAAVGARPPPLPPAVAALTPAPPVVAAATPSTKTPSQPPPAAAPTSAKNPTPAPPAPPAPTSAKNPTPAPPAPPAPMSARTSTQPPPAPHSLRLPTPPPPDDDEDGTEAPRKLTAAKTPPAPAPHSFRLPTRPPPEESADDDGWDVSSKPTAAKTPRPAPEPPAAPLPSQRAKLPTEAPDPDPPSDIVPTAPRPVPRRSPTIPPAPKLPSGSLGKPAAPRPNVPADDAAEDDEARRMFTDTLPSGITAAAIAQAEAAAKRVKAPIPAPLPGTKPLFEITKKPGSGLFPAVGVPRAPTPPRPATVAPKAPVPSVPRPTSPPSVGSPPVPSASSARTKSTLPPPPVLRESIAPPADPIRISNVELRGVEPFSQLPEEAQRTLVRTAIIEDLVPGEARTSFGAVLVVAGEISVCAVNLDVSVKIAPARSFVASQGSLAEPVPMRVVGGSSGATISRWSTEAFAEALTAHPQAAEDCRAASDALQGRIGLTLGALADVDLATREKMLSRLEVRALGPDEMITEEDGPMPGLVFVVGGSVEILEGDPAVVVADVRPGDLLFPEALWAGVAAPLQSRAAATGALLLVGERKLALDFAESVPIVGELLSR